MKTVRLLSSFALALILLACSKDNGEMISSFSSAEGSMAFRAVIAAPNGNPATRASYSEEEGPIRIEVKWEVNDEIALIHNGVKDVATVTTVNADGSAVIESSTFTGSPSDGDAVRLLYPASCFDSSGSGTGFGPSSSYDPEMFIKQDGTLEYIQNHDLRMADALLSVSGGAVSLSNSVSMDGLFAIWKLTLRDTEGNNLPVTQLTIKKGISLSEDSVSMVHAEVMAKTIELTSARNEFYMAVDIFEGNCVVIEGTNGTDKYVYYKTKLSNEIEPGKYYMSKRSLGKYQISNPSVGQIVGNDGKNYDAASFPSGVNKMAMIAYVDSDNHGLAIQLSDGNASVAWDVPQNGVLGLNDPASPLYVPGCAWRVPSKIDWAKMLVGCAETGDATTPSDTMEPTNGFRKKWYAATETILPVLSWTRTETSEDYAVWVDIDGTASTATITKVKFTEGLKTSENPYLFCLEF